MPKYTFTAHDDDLPGIENTHVMSVEGPELDFLPAVVQAFNDFLINAGFTYLTTDIEQPEHGVYIIRQERSVVKDVASDLPTETTAVLYDDHFDVGAPVYVAQDGGYDDRIVTGRSGRLVGIDHKNRSVQPYEVEFPGWTGGHCGTSKNKECTNRFFVTPDSLVHEGSTATAA